ncbi:MAG TPA: 4Fe-4S dicluster domain-containing protein [Candidatus Binataceae bacterium]
MYRLAQISLNIIDQCVAQGVPFAREYGGLLDTRSFGGVQVQRTFYARGQTGQQLLLGGSRRPTASPTFSNSPSSCVSTRWTAQNHAEATFAWRARPWRAAAFPLIRDLIVNRSAFDRIIQAGGFISAPTGGAPDANAILIPKEDADTAFDAAACIGCGACVAACPNAAAMLFTSAKLTHINSLPQGQPQRDQRTVSMAAAMANELFGSCTNHGECEAVCPKEIPLEFIGRMNRDLIRAAWHRHREPLVIPGVVQHPSHEDAHSAAKL